MRIIQYKIVYPTGRFIITENFEEARNLWHEGFHIFSRTITANGERRTFPTSWKEKKFQEKEK